MSVTGRIHSLESFGTVDGPGIRFVAFLQGCPMRCLFCHNPDTWDAGARVSYEWTPRQLLEEALRYRSYIRGGGVTVSGGEPLVQARFVAEYFRLCKENGLHTALDTSGVIFGDAVTGVPSEPVREAVDATDLVLLDVKTADDTLHKSYTGHERQQPQAFMDYLQRTGKPTWIRHVVVPGITYTDERLAQTAGLIAKYSMVERVELLPFHTMGAYKYEMLGLRNPLEGVPPLDAKQIEHARRLFRGILSCKVL